MTRRLFAPLLAAVLPALAAVTAEAQEIRSPYRFIETGQSVGVAAGYAFTSEGALDLGPAAALFLGARYNIRISGPFSAEGEVGFVPTTRMVWDTVPGDTLREVIGEANMRLVLASAALRFNLTGPRTWRGLQPFFVLGGGVAIDAGGDADAESELPEDVKFDFGTSFAGVLGGGIEWFPTESWSLRLDARNTLWKLETPGAFFANDRGRLIPGDEWAQNFMVSAGFAIHF